MRVCLLGKYPPIQGGVSATNYWTARGLAERGHAVFVVTNALEVEDDFRTDLDSRDGDHRAPPGVTVIDTEPFDPDVVSYVPWANPFVTKLASLACDAIRRYRCDVLYASYFEPYVVAASLAARWTGVPLVINHAGSDLDRLMRLPELAVTYAETLKSADAVITLPGLVPRFVGMGVAPERIEHDPTFGLPLGTFCPRRMEAPDLGRARIGVYGKVGEAKGSFDLVSALADLAGEGFDFELVAMTQGAMSASFFAAIEATGLGDRTRRLRFVPPWRVPAFLRTCTAVCILERDFPIAIHSPLTPREVLACGVCLVVSQEIAGKQPFVGELVDGENALIVPDPRDHRALQRVLARVIRDPALASTIGARGGSLSVRFEQFDAYVDGFAALLERVRSRSGRTIAPRPVTPSELAETVSGLEALLGDRLAPWTTALVDRATTSDRFALGRALCDIVERNAHAIAGIDPELVTATVSYARARLWTSFHEGAPLDRDPPGARAWPHDIHAGARPRRSAWLRVETFAWDVTRLFDPEETNRSAPTRQRTHVCFLKPPNLDARELRLGPLAFALLELCDGSRDVPSVFDELQARRSPTDPAELRAGAASALAQLYRTGAIVFVEDAA